MAEAPKLLRLRRKDSMMVGRQINKRTREGAQMYRHPAHAYPLQAAPRPVVAMKDRERWHCDVCGYEWSPDGEQKKRYMSVNPREAFNICGDCMLAPWSAWVSQKNKLLGGDSIVFSDVLHLGSVDAGKWADPKDREGVLQQLDHHRRLGDLPWRATTSRWLRLHVGGLELVTDLSLGPEDVPEPGQPFRIYTGMKLDEIMTITYIDDTPHHLLLIYAVKDGVTICHVLVITTAEMAVAMCEAVEKTLHYVYQQAILHAVDDHILAGLEGRSTQMEQQKEERTRIAASSPPPLPLPAMGDYGSDESDDEFGDRRRGSIFDLFPKLSASPSDGEGVGNVAGQPASPPQRPQQQPPQQPPQQPQQQDAPAAAHGGQTLVMGYMRQLQAQLSNEELQRFALLLKSYRTGGSFESLTSGLIELYGPLRANLLPGMINFVPSADQARYTQFLTKLKR